MRCPARGTATRSCAKPERKVRRRTCGGRRDVASRTTWRGGARLRALRQVLDDVRPLAGRDHPEPPRLALERRRLGELGLADAQTVVLVLELRQLRAPCLRLSERRDVGRRGPR